MEYPYIEWFIIIFPLIVPISKYIEYHIAG
jgi:hypothetical protein